MPVIFESILENSRWLGFSAIALSVSMLVLILWVRKKSNRLFSVRERSFGDNEMKVLSLVESIIDRRFLVIPSIDGRKVFEVEAGGVALPVLDFAILNRSSRKVMSLVSFSNLPRQLVTICEESGIKVLQLGEGTWSEETLRNALSDFRVSRPGPGTDKPNGGLGKLPRLVTPKNGSGARPRKACPSCGSPMTPSVKQAGPRKTIKVWMCKNYGKGCKGLVAERPKATPTENQDLAS